MKTVEINRFASIISEVEFFFYSYLPVSTNSVGRRFIDYRNGSMPEVVPPVTGNEFSAAAEACLSEFRQIADELTPLETLVVLESICPTIIADSLLLILDKVIVHNWVFNAPVPSLLCAYMSYARKVETRPQPIWLNNGLEQIIKENTALNMFPLDGYSMEREELTRFQSALDSIPSMNRNKAVEVLRHAYMLGLIDGKGQPTNLLDTLPKKAYFAEVVYKTIVPEARKNNWQFFETLWGVEGLKSVRYRSKEIFGRFDGEEELMPIIAACCK